MSGEMVRGGSEGLNGGEFLSRRPVSSGTGVLGEGFVGRQTAEIQGAMVIAKKFPRDEAASFARIMKACSRKGLAECAQYQYPKGGAKVSGPSIRLAEVLAQNWGNLDFGLVEMERRGGESTMMAYCWDLETNVRQVKVFSVPHGIKTKSGFRDISDDPREIYELAANQGARRLRACILGVIPGDIVDAAMARCEETLIKGEKTPLADRIRAMVSSFSEFGVTKDMIEERLGYRTDALNEKNLVDLRKIYTSIKDGMSEPADWFTPSPAKSSGRFESGVEGDAVAEKPRRGRSSGVKPETRSAAPAPATIPADPADSPVEKWTLEDTLVKMGEKIPAEIVEGYLRSTGRLPFTIRVEASPQVKGYFLEHSGEVVEGAKRYAEMKGLKW